MRFNMSSQKFPCWSRAPETGNSGESCKFLGWVSIADLLFLSSSVSWNGFNIVAKHL